MVRIRRRNYSALCVVYYYRCDALRSVVVCLLLSIDVEDFLPAISCSVSRSLNITFLLILLFLLGNFLRNIVISYYITPCIECS